MDIHNNLKETVANGYLSRSYNGGRNYALWKNYFRRNFCNLPIHEDCNATRDLAYLERKGYIKIGDYDVLIDIFRKIDERAIQYIEKKTSDIKAVGKGRCDVVMLGTDLEIFPNWGKGGGVRWLMPGEEGGGGGEAHYRYLFFYVNLRSLSFPIPSPDTLS